MSTLCWRKALHFVGARFQTHRAIVKPDLPVCVLPGNGVLEPILVIALLKVVTRMRASRFSAGNGGMSISRPPAPPDWRAQGPRPTPRSTSARSQSTVTRSSGSRRSVSPFIPSCKVSSRRNTPKPRLHRFLHLRTNFTRFVAALAMGGSDRSETARPPCE